MYIFRWGRNAIFEPGLVHRLPLYKGSVEGAHFRTPPPSPQTPPPPNLWTTPGKAPRLRSPPNQPTNNKGTELLRWDNGIGGQTVREMEVAALPTKSLGTPRPRGSTINAIRARPCSSCRSSWVSWRAMAHAAWAIKRSFVLTPANHPSPSWAHVRSPADRSPLRLGVTQGEDTPGGGGGVRAEFGMAKFGAEKIWPQF